MQRWIRVLAVVLVLQLALAAALAVRSNPVATAPPDAALLPPGVQTADDIVIEGAPANAAAPDGTAATSVAAAAAGKPAVAASQPSRVELARRNGAWVLPGYYDAPVNGVKLSELLRELVMTRRGMPIATQASARRRFRVGDAAFERRVTFRKAGHTLATLYLGRASGARQTAARTAAGAAIYIVALGTYDLPTANADWFDRALLQRDPSTLIGLDAATPRDHVTLQRPPQSATQAADGSTGWTIASLPPGQKVDPAHAESLADAVAGVTIQQVLGMQPLPAWHQDRPLLQLALTDAQHRRTTWALSKPDGADFYVLKSSAHPWYFALPAATGKALVDDSARTALLTTAATAPAHPRPAHQRSGRT